MYDVGHQLLFSMQTKLKHFGNHGRRKQDNRKATHSVFHSKIDYLVTPPSSQFLS